MSDVIENVLFHYLKNTEYSVEPSNQVGTDADFLSLYPTKTPLRTVPTPTGNTAYVRKFGEKLSTATSCTDIAAMSDANELMEVYASDGTLMGSKTGAGAFVPGTSKAGSYIYVVITASGAGITVDSSVIITFGGRGAVTVEFPAEAIASGDSITYYIANDGSTYYDIDMKYGGVRRGAVLNNFIRPYRTITAAYAALAASNNDGVEILDSETYDEDLTTDGQALDSADTIIYSSAGETPTITRGVGARITREQTAVFTNINAIFWNENGNDSNPGTWQEPKLTMTSSDGSRVAQTYIVYGGSGATVNGSSTETYTSTGGHVDVEYGYTPTLKGIFNLSGNNVIGLTVVGIIQKTGAYGGTISECTIKNSTTHGIYIVASQLTFTGTISNNIIHSNGSSGIRIRTNREGEVGGTISNNIIYSNGTNGIYLLELLFSVGASTISSTVSNNICYDNTDAGINIAGLLSGGTTTVTATLSNNTLFNNNYGILGTGINNYAAASCINNITNSNTTYDLSATSLPVSYTAYETQELVTLGAGNITADPKFCKNTLSYKLGLSSDSPCYRTGSTNDDIGALLRIIEIDAADIVINGIKIDGQNQFNNNIFIRDTANHTGFILKWCNIYNAQGIAIDLYDNDTNLDSFINNNIISNSGNGLKLSYGGNEINNNIINGNSVYGMHSNYTVNTISHNVFYSNQYGLYLESNSSGNTIINNIFDSNSLYGIFSEVAKSLEYNCITDSNNSFIDISSLTNIIDSPLFVDTDSNDFRLKSVERGSLLDSPCLDVSSDSTDIGAYQETRTTVGIWWEKYKLARNPTSLPVLVKGKGVSTSESGFGIVSLFAKSNRLSFPMTWGNPLEMTEIQRKTLQAFSQILPTRENGLTKDQSKFLIHIQPTSFLLTGTAGVISATNKTLTDTSKSLVRNEVKGYWLGVRAANITGDVEPTFKTFTISPAPSWTASQYVGYRLYFNDYYYYIKSHGLNSNGDMVLTLYDPNDTLINETISSYVEKYFKILSNTTTVITLKDDDSELVAGTLGYYVDFCETKLISPNFSYAQRGAFIYKNEHWKADINLEWEEV